MSTVPEAPVKPAVSKMDGAAGSSSSTAADSVPVIPQEYSVRVPKSSTKPLSIMRFNKALGVEPAKWNSLKMVREGHAKRHKPPHPVEDAMPKFGAGSEYGREAREEAKRRKYGGVKVNLEVKPWIMKTSGDKSRKYRGVKEGGLLDNSSYYIFTQAADGAFEVFPVNHWYNFTPIQRYKSLTAEEAEEQFGRRNKIHNYFSVMVRKRFKADEEEDEAEVEGAKVKKAKYSTGLQVREMDEWGMDSDGDSDNEGEKKPKKKKDSGGDAEDSDDGDEDGREVEYISDSSESESEEEAAKKNAVIGVDQEDALKKLLDSDSEEEEKKPEEAQNDPKSKKSEEESIPQENLSDDEDEDEEMVDGLDNAKVESSSSGTTRDGTPDVDVGPKRKATSDLISGVTSASNKAVELSPLLVQAAASEGITEEAVRRYLLRKPMTVTELLKKFKPKKKNISSHDMVNVIAHLLKKINPVKKTQNQKMYLYLTQT